tara:strand:+ start:404 stop:877 length:474 start_codon:yes stop_codon:yes gene_type:complete
MAYKQNPLQQRGPKTGAGIPESFKSPATQKANSDYDPRIQAALTNAETQKKKIANEEKAKAVLKTFKNDAISAEKRKAMKKEIEKRQEQSVANVVDSIKIDATGPKGKKLAAKKYGNKNRTLDGVVQGLPLDASEDPFVTKYLANDSMKRIGTTPKK